MQRHADTGNTSEYELTEPQDVVHALASVAPGTRLVSICTGAFILAEAGLLDGRPATTHWVAADLFRARFPQVAPDPDVLFIDNGDVLTSAGAASGIDICLHLIRKDHGSEVANQAARMCVGPPWRDGGQAQYIQHPVPEATSDGTAPARQWALENLHEPITLADLAERSHMSLRTLNRRFPEEVGMSPGRWLIQQRINRARHLLEPATFPWTRSPARSASPAAAHYENTCMPPSASLHSPTGVPSAALCPPRTERHRPTAPRTQ